MNDNTAQDPQSNSTYVDDYQPPGETPAEPPAETPAYSPAYSPTEPVTSDVSGISQDQLQDMPLGITQSDGDDVPAQTPVSAISQKIDDQNIFFMLGADNGTEALKESFLDELQEVIWNDFLENDVNLLITSDEKVKFDSIMEMKQEKDDQSTNKEASDEIQEALVSYLETLIPDLEEIMLEKALDLKSDLFIERINGLRDLNSADSVILEKINAAEKLMNEDKWYSAAEMLNEVED